MKSTPHHNTHTARLPMIAMVCTVLALLALASLFLSKPTSTPNAPPAALQSTPPLVESKSLYGALLGRWARTDGDYLLDVQTLDGSGNAQVHYYNPRPIHVARAEATREGERLRLTVVLEDVGYPGSYYTLHLTTGANQLHGEYYQASLQQIFEVTFHRLP